MRSRERAWLAGSMLFLIATGCSTHRAVTSKGPGNLAWPAGNPRIRLESLIDLGRTKSGGSSRLLGWLGGEQSSPIFQRPYAVAWDDEHLLVADPDAGRVARIAPGGRITLSPEGLFVHPIGIAACPAGVVVTDSGAGRVALLDRELESVRWLAENLSRPTGVGCDGDRIFFAETGAHRISVIEPGGAIRHLGRRGEKPGEFNFPAPIAIDDGALLVGDTLNFRIQRLDPSTGQSIELLGHLGDSPGETPRIKGVAVDATGRIWVTDGLLDRLSLYDRDGAFLMSLGGTGMEPGRFSFPAGIAAHPDGRVVVADSLNRRLQVFNLLEPEKARTE